MTRTPVKAIAAIVAYNWRNEETDYSREALKPGNSRAGHIFRELMRVQRWLETEHGYPHVEPRIKPDPHDPEPAWGKTLGEMTPAERQAVTERALTKFQAELIAAAPGITRVLDDFQQDERMHALIRAARGWIADCAWADLGEGDVAELSDAQVIAGVSRHYEGGWAAFAAAEGA
jgi:hypothetical protein